ncbi:MAG: tricarboxylate transporter [Pelagibacteraceae bacterium]|nr:tricarboxylate transporter [Pelagibacteraceae bacterium]
METFGLLLDGIFTSLQWFNLGLLIFGCLVGLFVGAMPGLGSVNGVAILIPITFIVPPTAAIIFLAAVYYGAMYGGAISSVMLGIPGASTAVATVFDGRPLAQKGDAITALSAAAVGSFVGGTVSVILFTLFAPPLAEVALAFNAPETFALMVMAFATFVGLGGDDIPKTVFSILIGLLLSTIGLDLISGKPRLILFGMPGFLHGINFLVLAIGIYGIGEMLWTLESTKGKVQMAKMEVNMNEIGKAFKKLKSTLMAMSIGSFLGFFVGILPAAGATPASLMSYGITKQLSKNSKEFGTGVPAGVVAPECANNSASTGSMLPMLTLGIPGSPTTAILLGGMILWGLTPGPLLFTQEPEFVWGLIGSLYIANFFTLVLNIALIPAFLMVLRIPFAILAPVIFVLCVTGGYAPTQSLHDVWLMLIFGFVGYVLRKLDYPVAPAVLSIVLGPLAENALRQTLILSDGSMGIFFDFGEKPIAASIMYIALVFLLMPLAGPIKRKFFKAKSA